MWNWVCLTYIGNTGDDLILEFATIQFGHGRGKILSGLKLHEAVRRSERSKAKA